MKLFSHYIEQQKKRYPEIKNWENYYFGDRLAYSYRDTVYDRINYPSDLHYHDYYEMVIFEEGNIQYICGGNVYHLNYGDIILIPPGEFHISVITCEKTHYKRHVFYLYPSAFAAIGHSVLTSFLTQIKSGELLTIGSLESRQELMELLRQLKKTFSGDITPLDEALGLSYLIRIFCLLNQNGCRVKNEAVALPDNILELQHYIDQNFAQISSVSQVAEHFFYSREYVSRLFRKYFDTTISDYIMKRRIAESQLLIVQNLPMTDIAYRVGFGSLSTFIRAFRTVTGMTPSEYRKLRKEIQL